jgi:hypothetical protein
LSGAAKRKYIAETTIELLDKSNRKAEREFGWGRKTVEKLTKEAMNICKNGIKRLENLPKWDIIV